MAVVYESFSYTALGAASGGNMVITKPTGLAVGDLMIAQILIGGYSLTGQAGFTEFNLASSSYPNSGRIHLLYKIADAADVAASNFTFSFDYATASCAGGILRFSGASIPQPVLSSSSVSSWNGTGTFLPSIITLANSIIVISAVAGSSGGAAIMSGYAIATSNPSWTELWDEGSVNTSNSIAYSSVRTQTTDTGVGSVTFSQTFAPGGVLFCIPPDKSILISETITLTETWLRTIKMYFPEVITLTETITSTIGKWYNQAKSAISSWTNTSKS